ncbi:MAG: DoxX family protein [gamma proteobacterium symbiont of Bathyaustriella thionipta]|nr:DoxX family protein [gamma proteobacterium symbiont of Bathyaustriella thionipta]
MIGILNKSQDFLDKFRALDFLGPLALRLYLAPIFWSAGCAKLGIDPLFGPDLATWFSNLGQASVADTAAWFGNPDWGLGLPFPDALAWLAAGTEVIGAVLLVIGLGVRWIAPPLMFTMIIAIVAVHWQNGWLMVADSSWPIFTTERIEGAGERLAAAKQILETNGNMDWLTANGHFVVLNNGIEMAATYLIMLLPLFFIGGGRYFSLDYWIKRGFRS